jgi:hypothetical protein
LGDLQTFAEIHSKSQAEQKPLVLLPVASDNDFKDGQPIKIKQARLQQALLATNSEMLRDLANYPMEYIANLRTLQEAMIAVKNQCLERSTTLVKFLPIYEQTSLNKEAAMLANWQERQRQWGRIQTHISRKVGTPKVLELLQHERLLRGYCGCCARQRKLALCSSAIEL